VKRPLYLFNEFGHVIERKPWLELAEIPGGNDESPPLCRCAPARQAAPQHVIDNLAKGSPGSPRFGLELRGDIVIEAESGSHLLMLSARHHDVKSAMRGTFVDQRCCGRTPTGVARHWK
jgi:hypothetical protein